MGLFAYLSVMVTAVVVTGLAVPPLRLLSRKVGALAQPGSRTVHAEPTPVLGGAAIYIGMLAAIAVAWRLPQFQPLFEAPRNLVGVVVAATILFVAGLVDDLREISAPAKLAAMVLAGSVLSLVGMTIIYFRVPFVGFTVLPPDMSALVTVLWVVGMANAVNLIDGLDGLAAGIVMIASGSFFLYGWRLLDVGVVDPSNVGPLIAIITAGVCVGFLPGNFNPANIFMGDSGALLLGGLLASSTIAVGGQSDDPFSGQAWFFFAPLVIPLLILGVPVLDVAFALIRRATKRQGVATPDKQHLHHRLMNLGHGHRRTVLLLWGWTGLLSAFVLFPVFTARGNGVVPIGLAALALFLFTMFAPRLGRSDTNGDANDIGPAHDDVSVENRAESADSIERGRVSGDGDGLGVDSGTDDRSGKRAGGGAVTDDLDTADEHVVKTD